MQQNQENTSIMSSQQDEDGLLEIDLSVLLKAVRTRIPLIIAICTVVIALAVAYAMTRTPLYKAPVRMLVEQGALKVTDIQDVYSGETGRDANSRTMFMTTQMEMIKSPHILARVFDHFSLGDSPEYVEALAPLKLFQESVIIDQVPKTSLLDISFLSPNPAFSAKIANYIAQVYIDDSRQRATGFSERGLEKLEDELLLMEQRRNAAIDTLNNYKKEHNILSMEAAQSLAVARITALDSARVQADQTLMAAEASLQSVEIWRKQGRRLDSIPEILQGSSIAALKMKRLDAQLQRAQKQILNEIDIAIKKEIENSIISMQATKLRAQTSVELIETKQEDAQKDLTHIDQIAAQYRLLEDKLKASENAYRLVLQRVNELYIAKSADSGSGGTFQILVSATPPVAPAYPEKKKIVVLAALAAFMFSVMLCIVLELLDSRLQKKEDLENITRLPVFGFIPRVLKEGEEHPELVAWKEPRGSLAEAFRALRTSLSLSEATRRARLLTITSSVQGEGKSFTAMNIAIAQAKAGKKVLLIDADMHRRSVTKMLLPDAESGTIAGLSNILAEAVGFDEIATVLHRPFEGITLDLIPSGPMPPNPAELLGSSLTEELCQYLLQSYDLVIFDVPPVLNVTDSRTLAGIPDMRFLLVVRMLSTEKKQVRTTMEILRTVRANVAGTVINNASIGSESGYGYGYSYGYGYGYGYGYEYAYGYGDDAKKPKKRGFFRKLFRRA